MALEGARIGVTSDDPTQTRDYKKGKCVTSDLSEDVRRIITDRAQVASEVTYALVCVECDDGRTQIAKTQFVARRNMMDPPGHVRVCKKCDLTSNYTPWVLVRTKKALDELIWASIGNADAVRPGTYEGVYYQGTDDMPPYVRNKIEDYFPKRGSFIVDRGMSFPYGIFQTFPDRYNRASVIEIAQRHVWNLVATV